MALRLRAYDSMTSILASQQTAAEFRSRCNVFIDMEDFEPMVGNRTERVAEASVVPSYLPSTSGCKRNAECGRAPTLFPPRRYRSNGTAPTSSIRSSPEKRQIPTWPRLRSPFASQSMLPDAPS